MQLAIIFRIMQFFFSAYSPLIAIEVPSRIVTRVIGKAGRILAALPDFDNVDEAEEVAIAAIFAWYLWWKEEF